MGCCASSGEDPSTRRLTNPASGSVYINPATAEGFDFAERIEDGQIWERYKKNKRKPLGRGVSCQVWQVTRRTDGTKFALKQLTRAKSSNRKLFTREVKVLQQLRDHPHVTHLDCCLIDDMHYYVLTRLCTGGQLFARVKELKQFSEYEAAKILAAILSTVQHCHDHKIAHRDLKLENLVYSEPAPAGEIVVIDFGDAMRITKDNMKITNLRGTLPYLAPESFRTREGWELLKADVWSIGVIAFLLLAGRYPFWGADRPLTERSIQEDPVLFPEYVQLSDSAKDFVQFLLNRDPMMRPTCQQALDHPWIRTEAKKFRHHLGDRVLQSLARHVDSTRLRAEVVDHLVRHMSREDMAILDSAFHMIDRNNDGVIDRGDIIDFYRQQSIYKDTDLEAKAEEVLQTLGGAGFDGVVDRVEFHRAKKAEYLNHDTNLLEEFDRLDVDRDGFISIQDLKQGLSVEQKTAQLQKLIREVDQDGDDMISRAEFEKAMNLDSLVPE